MEIFKGFPFPIISLLLDSPSLSSVNASKHYCGHVTDNRSGTRLPGAVTQPLFWIALFLVVFLIGWGLVGLFYFIYNSFVRLVNKMEAVFLIIQP